jgi:2-oxoisovalerate dehydrogenase E2 component (dihydrolipoyl transacylase)
MTVRDFKLPDLGEGLTESELVSWRVEVGDEVKLNQVIAEVETAKALVELPSPFVGVVAKLYEQPGSVVAVGSPIVAFEVDDGAEGADVAPKVAGTGAPTQADVDANAGRNSVLVGYGPPVDSADRPARKARRSGRGHAAQEAAAASATRAMNPGAASGTAVGNQPETAGEDVAGGESSSGAIATERPRSTPPVRKLARDLNVDLTLVRGTGENGLITRDDVQAAQAGITNPSSPVTAEVEKREVRTPIKGVRKQTAAAMVSSAFTAVHATEFLTIDVTPTMELLARLKAKREFRDYRINILTVVAKALCLAVRRNPSVNSHWDEESQEIVQFHYVNLGIAAATPRGLVVPNIKDADRLSIAELSEALAELTQTARAGKATPADLSHGTISITNIGVFGIDAGTPILNPGEAAILAMGAVRREPREYLDEIALRQVMTLSLSFDHRLVDGEQGSKFLAAIGQVLADPGMLLAMV